MNRLLTSKRWILVVALVMAASLGLGWPLGHRVQAQQRQPTAQWTQELASVEQLKSEAFKALRGGQFARTMELLSRARELSPDPQLEQMTSWLSQFESQWQQFAAERQQQYGKQVADVQKLLAAGKDVYALSWAARAYPLADDRQAFEHEAWVRDLVARSTKLAAGYELDQQWLKAMRIYSDLGTIEPASVEWKEKLKLVTRRIRLLALYAPDQLKSLQEAETKERDEVEAMLHPTTKPATKPVAAVPANGDDPTAAEDSRLDWRDTLKDIRYDMLWDALDDARTNYYRDVTFRTLTLGGLKGLQALATTPGLDKAFPLLGDEARRRQFVESLRQQMAQMEGAEPDKEKFIARGIIAQLKGVNRDSVNLPEEVLTSEFADGALGELDPFSSMIWPSDIEEFNKSTQGEFSGVGIQIQLDEANNLKVVSPLEDSPAYKAKIQAGDLITHINGKSSKGITLSQAVRKITGPPGTMVTLTIKSPDGTVRDHALRRDTIKVASIKGWSHRPGGGWDYFIDRREKVAYIRLTNFTKTTGDELDHTLDQLHDEGAQAIILDLRYNPGGLLTAATEVVDKFIKEGVIVSTRADRETPNQPTVINARSGGKELKLPLVVLVNQYSASASEIVSGALKDQKRAMVVGERTFGKGSVQMLFPVSDKSACLKLTTSHYYLPSGRCIHREENSSEWGVDPDMKVEMTPEQMRQAIEARQGLDVLRDTAVPAEDPQQQPQNLAATTAPTTSPSKKDPLTVDPQLSASLLLLRLQLAGAPLG